METGSNNPIRYRSYYYDTETGFYYLQTRYYDPETGRFINADAFKYLGADGPIHGMNLYSYCGNNPVKGYDPEGHFNWGGFLLGAALVVAGAAIIIASGGAAAPGVIATGAALTKAIVGAAIATTGVHMAVAAARDEAMVLDATVTIPVTGTTGSKFGISMVLDFGENSVEAYPHGGEVKFASTSAAPSFAFSSGPVFNYNGQGDYGGEFVNAGGSVGGIEFEVCGAPCPSDDSTSAVCTTFSFPCSPTDAEAHAGYDYYQSCWYWDIDG